MKLAYLALLLGYAHPGLSAHSSAFDFGSDLNSFVSAPLLKPPLFNVTHIEPDKISKGYWFLAPYASLKQSYITGQLETCQVGPHIFDNNGSLIWSGACDVQNSNVFDFKLWKDTTSSQMSFIISDRIPVSSHATKTRGIGAIMNHGFNQSRIRTKPIDREFNMHEFTIIDEGRRGIMLTNEMGVVNTPESLRFPNNSALAWKGTILELDMTTGVPVFEWNILDHIPMTESSALIRASDGQKTPWDWIHPNSVDKNDEGDYLLSARLTDCIYKISGKDGSIIWRLGGKNSSFVLNGFNFSRQHDARFRGANGGKTLISFLNNGADEFISTSNTSAAYLVELDTANTPMTARLVKEWLRPDGGLSRLRGNMQMLDNGNVFVGWSQQGYLTEFDSNGKPVLEAKFMSDRFRTYRAYKLNFTGRPSEPPAVKAISHGLSMDMAMTAIYVSWNGATDVASWKIYGAHDSAGSNFSLLDQPPKNNFETTVTVSGHYPFVYTEALSAKGQILGKSPITSTGSAIDWDDDIKPILHTGSSSSDSNSGSSQSSAPKIPVYDCQFHQWWTQYDPAQKYLYSLITGLILGVMITLITNKAIGRFT